MPRCMQMNAGRVYVVDYTSLKPFFKDPLQGVFMAAPVCYFYMMEDPHHRFSEEPACLLPIAIRLDPDNRDAPIFTPDDSQWDWNTAKVRARSRALPFNGCVLVSLG